jgi:hypothetical protein
MTDAVAKSAAVLGISSEAFRGFSAELNLSLEGLSDEQAQAAVIQGLTDMGNQFAGMAGNLGNLAREGEDAMTTLARLGNELQTVNGVMSTLGFQVYDVSIAGAAAASGLADMYGGIEQLTVATNAYYAAFYTTEEQLAHTTQGLTEAFAALGVAMPETRAGLRELIEGTAQDIAGARAVLEKPMPTFNFLSNNRDYFKASNARFEASSVISAASELQAGLISLSGTFDQMISTSDALALAAENTSPAINDNTAAMEDAARAAEELAAGLAEAISKERLSIQREIWRLMGDESSLRADDLSQLDASNRALQERLWGLQDEAEATEAAARAIEDLVQSLSPESFGQALDYNLALGRASQGIAGVTATGVPLSVVPNSNAANDSLINEIKNLKAELVNFKDESRGLNMNANADIRKIRLNSDRDQAIGTPAVRTS